MRTKTLLLSAVLGFSLIGSTMAQVYSVNVVGYVKKDVPQGKFALLTNPLDLGTNTIPAVLPGVPAQTKVYKWVSPSYKIYTWTGSSWLPAAGTTNTLNPGEGFFVKNDSAALNLVFVGDVRQSVGGAPLTTTYGAGFTLAGSQVPQEGKIGTDLGFQPQANDKIYRWDEVGQKYIISTYTGTAWLPPSIGEPTIKVGEGFFINSPQGGTWSRTFTVN